MRNCSPADWPGGDLVERLALKSRLGRPIAQCSLGTRAKLAIAATLLGSPPLPIFDESLKGSIRSRHGRSRRCWASSRLGRIMV
jgi:ABC-2 type transport system ATP-binding protein